MINTVRFWLWHSVWAPPSCLTLELHTAQMAESDFSDCPELDSQTDSSEADWLGWLDGEDLHYDSSGSVAASETGFHAPQEHASTQGLATLYPESATLDADEQLLDNPEAQLLTPAPPPRPFPTRAGCETQLDYVMKLLEYFEFEALISWISSQIDWGP